jgi:hypothetical protein
MPKFTVRYSLRYDHVVQIGVDAADAEAAKTRAQRAFRDGTLWDNKPTMPLLVDDWLECDDNTLVFEVAEVEAMPAPDRSVAYTRLHERASQLLDLLRRIRRCLPILVAPEFELPTHTAVVLAIDDIGDVKQCVDSLDGC